MRVAAACIVAVALTVTVAKADLTRQDPIEVRVNLGNAEDARVFEPNGISFEVGKLYRLVLHNPSKITHYFTSPGLADRVFTRKVEVKNADGKSTIGEINARSRSIRAAPPSGGSCRWRRSTAPGFPATSRTRTVRPTLRRVWSAASPSSDGGSRRRLHPTRRKCVGFLVGEDSAAR